MKKGATRWVILTRRYAIKFPALYSWKTFLYGLLANMSEVRTSKLEHFSKKVCPIIAYIPGGWLVVMPKAKILEDAEIEKRDLISFCHIEDNCNIPAEYKPDSFGWLNGKLVAIDYA